MPKTTLLPMPRLQFFDPSGVPLAGGKVFTYIAGTTTPLASYSDQSGAFPNSNPVILDSGGFAAIWLSAASYKIVVQDTNGVQQWTVDNVISWVDLVSDQTIAGNKTFTGAVIFNAAANFAGTVTVSGNLTATAGQNVLGQVSKLNNVLYVGEGITVWGVSDIGAQINAAYAALPFQRGGTIIVLPKSTGNSAYQFVTPITLNSSQKPVLLRGATVAASAVGLAGVILEYTPTSGAAITLDYLHSSGSSAVGHGIRDISIFNNHAFVSGGTGSAAIGILIGDSNAGAGYAQFSNVNIQGFGTGFQGPTTVSSLSWGMTFWNCAFQYNTIGYDSHTNMENTSFHSCKFLGNGTNVLLVGGDTYFYSCSFDAPTVASINLNWDGVNNPSMAEFYGCHFEDSAATSQLFITGNGNWKMFGGVIDIDKTTGNTTEYLHAGGGVALVDGTLIASSGNTCTQIVNFGAQCRGQLRFILSGTPPGPIYTPGFTHVSDSSFQLNGSLANPLNNLENLLSLANTKQRITTNFTTSSGTLVDLFSWDLPALAHNYSFECRLIYSQQTAAVGLLVGIQSASVAPTTLAATARIYSTLTGVSTSASVIITTTAATTVLTGAAPAAINITYEAYIWGTIENPATANTLKLQVATFNVADQITILRGSFAQLY